MLLVYVYMYVYVCVLNCIYINTHYMYMFIVLSAVFNQELTLCHYQYPYRSSSRSMFFPNYVNPMPALAPCRRDESFFKQK